MNEPVQRWNVTVKVIVALIVLILMALVLYRFREVIPPLVIAFLMAFILDPIVDFLTKRLRLSRGFATTLVFLTLIIGALGIIAAPVTVLPSVVELIDSGRDQIIAFITDISDYLSEPIQIWEYTLDLSEFYQDLTTMLRSFVSTVAQGTLDLAVTIASGAFWLVFIIMAAFYMVKDADRLIEQFDNLAPPGYREDFVRLRQRITDVWNAFLRGQLLLGLAMAVITTIVCYAIGLPYAWIMGLLAGLMEFIPSVGPIVAAVPAALIALFEGSNFLPLSEPWFTVLVIGAYVLIQQIEGNILIPRIMGRTLNLHPLLVFIGIIIGGSMAGILGMLLAAPVVATLRVLSYYIFCRLYDRDPFVEVEEDEVKKKKRKKKPARPGIFKRTWQGITDWRQRMREQPTPCEETPARVEEALAEEKEEQPPQPVLALENEDVTDDVGQIGMPSTSLEQPGEAKAAEVEKEQTPEKEQSKPQERKKQGTPKRQRKPKRAKQATNPSQDIQGAALEAQPGNQQSAQADQQEG